MLSVCASAREPISYEHWSSCSDETRQLVTLALDGLGGAQALGRLQSIRRVGQVTESTGKPNEVTKFERLWIAPRNLYIRMEANGLPLQFALGPTEALLFPGDPKIPNSAIRLTDEEVEKFLAPVKDDPIHILKNRENLSYGFEAGDKVTFDGQPVQILHVAAEDREFEWWISLESGRILKIRRDKSESVRSDFREASGLVIPFDMLSTAPDGSTCRTILEKFEVNRPGESTARFPRPELVVMRLKVQPSPGSRPYYQGRSGYSSSSYTADREPQREFLDDPRIPVRVGDHYLYGSYY
jgi:hypothetical protein